MTEGLSTPYAAPRTPGRRHPVRASAVVAATALVLALLSPISQPAAAMQPPAPPGPPAPGETVVDPEIYRDLMLLTDLLRSLLRNGRPPHVEGTYIAGQGFVFDVRAELPIEQGLHIDADIDFEFPDGVMRWLADFPGVLDSISEGLRAAEIDTLPESIDLYRDHAEKIRKLREDKQELAAEIRILERRMRESDGRERDELGPELDALASEMGNLSSELARAHAELKRELVDVRKQAQARQRDRLIAAEQARQQLETRLIDGLCRFGGGLKSIDRIEGVAAIIRTGGPRRERSSGERIVSVSAQDLRACRDGGIDSAGLTERAIVYEHPRSRH